MGFALVVALHLNHSPSSPQACPLPLANFCINRHERQQIHNWDKVFSDEPTGILERLVGGVDDQSLVTDSFY